MTEKNVINYQTADGKWISFRESKAEFAPTKDEFSKLKSEIVEILGEETTPEFDDGLDYLITLMREKAFIHATSMSVTGVQKELAAFTRHLSNLRNFLDNDLSDETERLMSFETIKKFDDTGGVDAIYALSQFIDHATEISENTINFIKGKKSPFTPNDMRQVLAEEIARELDKMGVGPNKYRDGKYFKILKSVLKSISCTVLDTRISISIPEDLFKVASRAIDEFPTKERYSLLNIE